MSISSVTRKAGPYTGNGVTTSFPFAFKVFAAGDIVVTQTDLLGIESVLALTTNYTVSLNSNQDSNPGGSVTMLVAPIAGYMLTLSSGVQNLQPVTLTNNGGFFPAVINDAFDRVVIQIQQLAEQLSRALKYSISSPLGDAALPAPVANNVIGWNSAANGFQNYAPVDNTLLAATLSLPGGAALIGTADGGTMALSLTSKLNRVVDSIATLKTLGKTKYTRAFVTGYYAAGDGGGGAYWYDSTDTTSTDNGGTIIVAADGGRWKLDITGPISVCQFGAVGNANFYNETSWFKDAGFTTASHDDTAAIQAAVTYCANNYRTLFVPASTPFLITAKVSATRGFSFIGEAPSPSEILSQSPHNKGSVIVSTVAADYTFEFGLAGTYERGMRWENMRIFTKGTTTKGTMLRSMGWDGYYANVIHEGFTAGGVYLDYVQDAQFNNCGLINCGTDTAQAALTFNRNCNQLLFNRLHIEVSTYMMDMGSSTSQVYFNGCHFETSEYSQAPTVGNPYYFELPAFSSINRYYKNPTIRIYGGSQNIDFSACTFGANTVQGNTVKNQGLVPVYPTTFNGLLENNVPYMVSVAASSVFIRGCFFLQTSGSYSSKFLDFSGSSDCIVSDNMFLGAWNNGYSITLSGVKFLNNTVSFNDLSANYVAPYNQKFYGIFTGGSYCVIDNVNCICPNGAAAVKNEGYLFAHTYAAGQRHVLGNTNATNANNVSKYNKHHTASFNAKHSGANTLVDLTAAAGNLDLEIYDINSLFSFSGNNPLSTIINPAYGQRVQIVNNYAGGTVQVSNTATVNLKGAASAFLTASYGMLTLAETFNGKLVEEARNF